MAAWIGEKVARFGAGLSAALRVLASTRATLTPFKRHRAAVDDARSARRHSFFTIRCNNRVTERRDIAVDFEAVERNGTETDRKRKLWFEEQSVGDCKLSDGREL